ncbi:MAG: A/G-specific adenine glycosylase [Chloroflexi bacterium]|nr:A/G-specific adenine glycosylase [Chloroflexota bacterium]MCI0574703.1 A/G-specific adenine glycosylase [Chloroflexota bacterium]MCI0647404.1 A/G-specific adenine glycosylase [Chloroflexota bacterium]MCI0728883.1 A/G-specific adenine glycosylase [Chloroflexota bacterium]
MSDLANIAPALLAWWDAGHADLPWRRGRDPYAVWVAEVMLQQTQITTVIPYYERWMARFPTVQALAAASLDEVLKLWEGLGYYSRARHLHAAAQTVVNEYGGRIPDTVAELIKLKGIGRYTAGAIASIAFGRPVPVLDGNVIRVLSRLLDLPDDVTGTATRNYLWQVVAQLVPAGRPGDFNQALMELGQAICLPAVPLCHRCPVAAHCLARARGTQLERPVRPPRRKTPHYHVTAGVIWGEDGRFLITRRPAEGLLGGLWEFPGGKQEEGETLAQALQREIREELDIDIEVSRPLTVVKHAYTHFRITLHAFHARHLAGRPQNLGVADHAWVRLPDLMRYAFAVTDRKIIEALTQDSNSNSRL